MKVLTIEASKSINPGTGESWYRAELKVSMDDNEVPEEVFQSLKERLDNWLPNPFQTTTITPQKRTREEEIKAHIQTINECKTLRNLQMFAGMVQRENVPELFEAFNNKKKELQ